MTSIRNDAFLFKLLLVGDSGVGKTCCLLRFTDDPFTPSFITTSIRIDFKVRNIELDGKIAGLQIWDTAGQERFRTITAAYYRDAMGILLVYNVEQSANKNAHKILIGNKCDSEDERAFSPKQGRRLAEELGMPFMEFSARRNINIEKPFYSLASDIKKSIEASRGEKNGISSINVDQQVKGLNGGSRGKCC
ncbi:unnamed protein product [Penicillium pancosmium]